MMKFPRHSIFQITHRQIAKRYEQALYYSRIHPDLEAVQKRVKRFNLKDLGHSLLQNETLMQISALIQPRTGPLNFGLPALPIPSPPFLPRDKWTTLLTGAKMPEAHDCNARDHCTEQNDGPKEDDAVDVDPHEQDLGELYAESKQIK